MPLRPSHACTASIDLDPSFLSLLNDSDLNHTASTGSGTATPPLIEHEDELTDDVDEHLVQTRTASEAALSDTFVRAVKRQRMLPSVLEGQLDQFIETPLQRQGVLTHALLLKVFDALQQLQPREVDFRITTDTDTNCLKIARGITFSGSLKAYRGNGPEIGLSALRESHTPNIPGPLHAAQSALVTSCISKHMIRFRNELKSKSTESLKVSLEERNIGFLAQAIIGDSNVQITVPFLQRIALLRMFIDKIYRGHENQFWVQFDAYLDALYNKPAATVSRVLQKVFDDDAASHGKVEASGITIVKVEERSQFQKLVDTYARTVERSKYAAAAASRSGSDRAPVSSPASSSSRSELPPSPSASTSDNA